MRTAFRPLAVAGLGLLLAAGGAQAHEFKLLSAHVVPETEISDDQFQVEFL
jgi:hypothetical protein